MKRHRREPSADTPGARHPPSGRVDERDDRRATQYLASERTFLAWIRTSIAVVALGFVIARFSVWLRELSIGVGAQVAVPGGGASLVIGSTMMAFGAVLALLAFWRFHSVNQAIERGEVRVDRGLVILITALVVLLATAMIVLMFTTV